MDMKRKIRFGPLPPDSEPEPEQDKRSNFLAGLRKRAKEKQRQCNCDYQIQITPAGQRRQWNCPRHGSREHIKKSKKKPACVCALVKSSAAPGETVQWNCPRHGFRRETMPGEPGWVLISSQYDGFCHVCKEDFPVGTMIYWKRGHGARHAQCHGTKNNIGEKNMGVWDGIEDAETFERGNYIKGGFIGVVEIKKTIEKPTRAIGPAFIVEMSVVETNMADHHPVGQKVTWFQKLTDKDVAFPAVTEWAAAVAGVDPTNKEAVKSEVSPHIKEALAHAVKNPSDNDFIGQKVRLQTDQIKTKNDRDFTRHTWMPFGDAA